MDYKNAIKASATTENALRLASATGLLNRAQSIVKKNAKTVNTLSKVYNLANTIAKAAGLKGIYSTGYRPSQWGKSKNSKTLIGIKSNIGGFFADAILEFSTTRNLTITSHPVQNGANISDHAYANPRTISCQLGISDSMANYTSDGFTGGSLTDSLKNALTQNTLVSSLFGQTTSNARKSYTALKLLQKMQLLRTPMTIVTPLGTTIDNMLIEEMSWDEGSDALYSIKINLTLKEIYVAVVSDTKVSARSWSTGGEANRGEVQGSTTRESTLSKMGF